MTTESGTRYCVWCDKPITGDAEKLPTLFSDGGARPDEYRHWAGDPGCGPRPASDCR